MKALVLSLIFVASSSALAADKASQAVSTTIKTALDIVALKSTDARNQQMCELVKQILPVDKIAMELLGDYGTLASDKAGIDGFINLLPSLAVTKMMGQLDKLAGNTVDVDENSEDRGDGTIGVGVTLHASNGNTYDATIVLIPDGNSFKLIDGEYIGFSAINYLGGQIQKKLGEEADSTHPITAYNKETTSASDFINCN